ncbi:MAG: PEGA domain-containing protein [Deltaproteobacteria bacterium]|nr:PEGA domain-containing protein [Deltaproteobacteria bacterium]
MRTSFYTFIVILVCEICYSSDRVAYFVITEDKRLSAIAQESEYFVKKYIEKRLYVPAEVSNRELAVFEDEMYRQNQEAASSLIEGKKLYEEFKIDQCFFVFQKIINNLEKGSAAFEKSKDYQHALMYLGNIYHLKGEITSAKETFIKLLMYSSKYVPDASYFPPDIIETFEQAKAEIKNLRRGTLQIIPKPEDAQVFLDGSFLGAGVFKVEDVFVGEHIVGIKKRGYLPYVRKVVVQPSLVEIVSPELVDFKEISERYEEISKIREADISGELLPVLKKYRKDTNSAIVVVVFVSGKVENFSLTGYTYYNDKLVAYGDTSVTISKDDSRKKILKAKVEELCNKILHENIKAQKPIDKISHKKFYTSWWFLGIVGATLVGATTLGYILLNGGEEKEDKSGALIISF